MALRHRASHWTKIHTEAKWKFPSWRRKLINVLRVTALYISWTATYTISTINGLQAPMMHQNDVPWLHCNLNHPVVICVFIFSTRIVFIFILMYQNHEQTWNKICVLLTVISICDPRFTQYHTTNYLNTQTLEVQMLNQLYTGSP